jgi:hypothetical protein
MPMPTFPLARLGGFRTELHACFTRRADALFELGDALLCAPAVPSLPHLSLEPVHRRGWGSAHSPPRNGAGTGHFVRQYRHRGPARRGLGGFTPWEALMSRLLLPDCAAVADPVQGVRCVASPARRSGWAW